MSCHSAKGLKVFFWGGGHIIWLANRLTVSFSSSCSKKNDKVQWSKLEHSASAKLRLRSLILVAKVFSVEE